MFAQVRPLTLAASGEARHLPERILGVSAEPFWDDLIGDPAKLAAVKSLHPGYTRFPGGSQSNYYDWKRGLFYVPSNGSPSAYYRRFITLASWVQRTHPRGISLEQYEAFSRSAGAEVIMVPNLETASVEDQVAWFKHLAGENAVPSHIELGNEFWAAMGLDRTVARHWPDEATSLQVTKKYLDAFRPYLPKGAKVAVQAAVPDFRSNPNSPKPYYQRLAQWNQQLRAEPWFDAVTVHFYPRLNEILGPGSARQMVTPQTAVRNFRALMARVDEGTERALHDVEQRAPGKEIWVTEFNPSGGMGAGQRGEERTSPTTPAMLAHLFTRMTLVFLRDPHVTVSQFFSIRFSTPDNPKTNFLPGSGGYVPVPVTVAVRWLGEAANGGATFQRFTEQGAQKLAGGAPQPESFSGIEAGLFRNGGQTTMIVQNVSPDARQLKLSGLQLGTAARIERLALPDLADPTVKPARIETVPAGAEIAVPPLSLTRIIWNGGGR